MIRYGLQMRLLQDYLAIEETANAASWPGAGGEGGPLSNQLYLYAKDKAGVSALYYKNDAGVEKDLSGGLGGTGASNRLAYWTDSTTLAAVAALTQGRVVYPDSNGLPTGSADLFFDGGDLGIGGSTPGYVGFEHALTIEAAAAGVGLELVSARTDADAAAIGSVDGWFKTNSANHNRIGVIQILTDGSTANQRGGAVRILTKANASTTLTERIRVQASGDIAHASDVRLRMLAQNRTRYLNAIVGVTKSGNQTGLTNSTWNTVSFDQEDFDTDTMHDNSSNNSRLTALLAGKYLVSGTVYVDDTNIVASQTAGLRFIKNGGTTVIYGQIFENTTTAIPGAIMSASGIVSLAVNDYMEMQAFCAGSSGTFDVFAGGPTTRFGMEYIGE